MFSTSLPETNWRERGTPVGRCVISLPGDGNRPRRFVIASSTRNRNLGKIKSMWAAQTDHSIDEIGARGFPGPTPPGYKKTYQVPSSSARSVITQFQGENRNFRSDQVYQIQHKMTSPQYELVVVSKIRQNAGNTARASRILPLTARIPRISSTQESVSAS